MELNDQHAELPTLVAPTAAQWSLVRTRMNVINSQLEEMEARLEGEPDMLESDEIVRRMEALQEKFEKVMGQLAAFDDEGGQAIREAKEEFRKILRRYRESRRSRGRQPAH
jgi:hypothetical protein